MTEFKLGDKVKYAGMAGEVTKITQGNYPVSVTFEGCLHSSDIFTNDGKYHTSHIEPLLFLVERPRVLVPFKDWEDGKKYKWVNGDTVYTKKGGLPYRVVHESYSANPITFFIDSDFYEVE